MNLYILCFYLYIFYVDGLAKRLTFHPPKYLQDITYHDCKRFIPDVKYAKVVKVYDGDTITVACKYPKNSKHLYRFSVRLAGIDAPEMNADSYIERVEANISKEQLHNLIYNKTVYLDNVRTEKYGRLLADVYMCDLHVNSWLLENNYAVSYFGGAKNKKLNMDNQ